MAKAAVVEQEVQENFIFGCVHDQNVILPDLVTGPRGSETALRFEPGQVIDLAEFFMPSKLRRSHSLKMAVKSEWLVPCETVDEVVTPKQRVKQSGEAPLNEFDERLAEELDKEEAELARLAAGRDALGARARRARAEKLRKGS